MEQLISDIEAFCARHSITPQKLLRDAMNATWGQWQDWKDGKSSPTMKVADRLRAYMAAKDAALARADEEAIPGVQGDAA